MLCNRLKSYTSKVIRLFFTPRGIAASKKITEKWLKKYGFPYHHIEMEKFVAHVYIDDRAINGCNWKKVVKELKRRIYPAR